MSAEFAMNKESIITMRRHQLMRVLCKYPRITVGEGGRKAGLSKTYTFNLLQGMVYRGLVVAERVKVTKAEARVLYSTAYDAMARGITVPELSEAEQESALVAMTLGWQAAKWYGYEEVKIDLPIQELLF